MRSRRVATPDALLSLLNYQQRVGHYVGTIKIMQKKYTFLSMFFKFIHKLLKFRCTIFHLSSLLRNVLLSSPRFLRSHIGESESERAAELTVVGE